jgi:hypothetical protein
LSTTGKLFEKVILRTIQKHIEERNLLNAGQFGFRANHSTTLQCMRLADHITINFNNMSTAAVFLHIEIASDKTWHSDLFYKSSELAFSTSLIMLIDELRFPAVARTFSLLPIVQTDSGAHPASFPMGT